jgi:ubiquinone/menaquinone biosynthesis C-methylase UbiE
MEEKNFLDPKEILKQLDVSLGSTVADFGCGSGFFSLAFAQAVGEEGKTYSFDILPSALESVESKAKMAGINNIIPQRANLEKKGGSKLPENSVDWVVMKDMLFQNKSKDIILEEAYRVLKTGGKIVIIEWNEQEASFGPEKSLRISSGEIKDLAEKQGFNFQKDLAAGTFHFGELFQK